MQKLARHEKIQPPLHAVPVYDGNPIDTDRKFFDGRFGGEELSRNWSPEVGKSDRNQTMVEENGERTYLTRVNLSVKSSLDSDSSLNIYTETIKPWETTTRTIKTSKLAREELTSTTRSVEVSKMTMMKSISMFTDITSKTHTYTKSSTTESTTTMTTTTTSATTTEITTMTTTKTTSQNYLPYANLEINRNLNTTTTPTAIPNNTSTATPFYASMRLNIMNITDFMNSTVTNTPISISTRLKVLGLEWMDPSTTEATTVSLNPFNTNENIFPTKPSGPIFLLKNGTISTTNNTENSRIKATRSLTQELLRKQLCEFFL